MTVDNLSASWTYDAANTILSGVTFKVTKVTTAHLSLFKNDVR